MTRRLRTHHGENQRMAIPRTELAERLERLAHALREVSELLNDAVVGETLACTAAIRHREEDGDETRIALRYGRDTLRQLHKVPLRQIALLAECSINHWQLRGQAGNQTAADSILVRPDIYLVVWMQWLFTRASGGRKPGREHADYTASLTQMWEAAVGEHRESWDRTIRAIQGSGNSAKVRDLAAAVGASLEQDGLWARFERPRAGKSPARQSSIKVKFSYLKAGSACGHMDRTSPHGLVYMRGNMSESNLEPIGSNRVNDAEWTDKPGAKKILPVGDTLLYDYLNRGLIEARKVGKKTIFNVESLRACVASLPRYQPKRIINTKAAA
jgi:hypothetical protein